MVSLHSYPYMGTSHTASSIMAKRIFFCRIKTRLLLFEKKKNPAASSSGLFPDFRPRDVIHSP